jgi:hypothetical protein
MIPDARRPQRQYEDPGMREINTTWFEHLHKNPSDVGCRLLSNISPLFSKIRLVIYNQK